MVVSHGMEGSDREIEKQMKARPSDRTAYRASTAGLENTYHAGSRSEKHMLLRLTEKGERRTRTHTQYVCEREREINTLLYSMQLFMIWKS